MVKVLFPILEKDQILSFGIEQGKIIQKNNFGDLESNNKILYNGDLDISANQIQTHAQTQFKNNLKIFNCSSDESYYDLHNHGMVTRFLLPKYLSEQSENLIKIFSNIVEYAYSDKQLLIRLKNICHDEKKVEKYIRLTEQLQNTSEEERVRIILDTEQYNDIFDIANFLKRLNITSCEKYNAQEFKQALKTLQDAAISEVNRSTSFMKIAKENGKSMESLGKVLSLTYPEFGEKYTSKGIIR